MARKRRIIVPRLSRADALQTYCSDCGAMPGEPCVYILGIRYGGVTPKCEDTRLAIERAGQPTKVPHNARVRHPSVRLQNWLADHAHILLQENHNDDEVHANRQARAVSSPRGLPPLRFPR